MEVEHTPESDLTRHCHDLGEEDWSERLALRFVRLCSLACLGMDTHLLRVMHNEQGRDSMSGGWIEKSQTGWNKLVNERKWTFVKIFSDRINTRCCGDGVTFLL